MESKNSSPLSKDLANILSKVKSDIEPPYKKFRSRSEENFYSFNVLDSDFEDSDLSASDTSFEAVDQYTGSKPSNHNSNNTSNSKVQQHVSVAGERPVFTTKASVADINTINNNKKNPTDSNLPYTVRNIKEELSFNNNATTTAASDIINPSLDKENIDYSVHTILQDFKRRQENSTLIRSLNHGRVFSLDDYEHTDFYMDDGVGQTDNDTGLYPILRYNRGHNLVECDNISDILNRTLETITEESEDLDNIYDSSVVDNSCKSYQAEPRSDCNSLMTTPRTSHSASNAGVDGSSSINSTSIESGLNSQDSFGKVNFQWENQLHSGYAESELLSEDDASTISESRDTLSSSNSKFGHFSDNNIMDNLQRIPSSSLSKHQPNNMSSMENQRNKSNTEINSGSSSSTLKSGSDVTPVHDVDKNITEGKVAEYKSNSKHDGNNLSELIAKKLGSSDTSSQSSKSDRKNSEDREKERLWYEDDTDDVDYHPRNHHRSNSEEEETYYSAKSSLDIPDKHSEFVLHRTQSNSSSQLVSVRDSLKDSSTEIPTLRIDSSFMFSQQNKPVDWENADLNSEIAESVILSDFVSDTESVYSRTGSVVSDYPDAIEAINAHLKEISGTSKSRSSSRRESGTLTSNLTKSDGNSTLSAGSIDKACNGDQQLPNSNSSSLQHDDTMKPKYSETVEMNQSKEPSQDGRAHYGTGGVHYEHFNPVYSATQFSVNSQSTLDSHVQSGNNTRDNMSASNSQVSQNSYNSSPINDSYSNISKSSHGSLVLSQADSVNSHISSVNSCTEKTLEELPLPPDYILTLTESSNSLPDVATLPRINVSSPQDMILTAKSEAKTAEPSRKQVLHEREIAEPSRREVFQERDIAELSRKEVFQERVTKTEPQVNQYQVPVRDDGPVEASTPKLNPGDFTFSVDQKAVEIVKIEHKRLYNTNKGGTEVVKDYSLNKVAQKRPPIGVVTRKDIASDKLYEKVAKRMQADNDNRPALKFPRYDRPEVDISLSGESKSPSDQMKSLVDLPKFPADLSKSPPDGSKSPVDVSKSPVDLSKSSSDHSKSPADKSISPPISSADCSEFQGDLLKTEAAGSTQLPSELSKSPSTAVSKSSIVTSTPEVTMSVSPVELRNGKSSQQFETRIPSIRAESLQSGIIYDKEKRNSFPEIRGSINYSPKPTELDVKAVESEVAHSPPTISQRDMIKERHSYPKAAYLAEKEQQQNMVELPEQNSIDRRAIDHQMNRSTSRQLTGRGNAGQNYYTPTGERGPVEHLTNHAAVNHNLLRKVSLETSSKNTANNNISQVMNSASNTNTYSDNNNSHYNRPENGTKYSHTKSNSQMSGMRSDNPYTQPQQKKHVPKIDSGYMDTNNEHLGKSGFDTPPPEYSITFNNGSVHTYKEPAKARDLPAYRHSYNDNQMDRNKERNGYSDSQMDNNKDVYNSSSLPNTSGQRQLSTSAIISGKDSNTPNYLNYNYSGNVKTVPNNINDRNVSNVTTNSYNIHNDMNHYSNSRAFGNIDSSHTANMVYTNDMGKVEHSYNKVNNVNDDYLEPISMLNPRDNNKQNHEMHQFQNNDELFPKLPGKHKVVVTEKTDVTTNILQQGRLEDEKQQIMRCTHNYENVYTEPYVPKSQSCTAMATSTALARKDFTGNSNDDHIGDAIVSAVASAEATGESPYVAVARATARAATIATASAAKGASKDDDQRDVTVMISTSCTIKDNGDNNDIEKDSKDVIKALQNDAKVAVYTRIAPNPNSTTSVNQYGVSNESDDRLLKVSIEQGGNDSTGKQSIEISLPAVADNLPQLITDSINKILQTKPAPGNDNSNDYIRVHEEHTPVNNEHYYVPKTNAVGDVKRNNNNRMRVVEVEETQPLDEYSNNKHDSHRGNIENNKSYSKDNSCVIKGNVTEQRAGKQFFIRASTATEKENINALNGGTGRMSNRSIGSCNSSVRGGVILPSSASSIQGNTNSKDTSSFSINNRNERSVHENRESSSNRSSLSNVNNGRNQSSMNGNFVSSNLNLKSQLDEVDTSGRQEGCNKGRYNVKSAVIETDQLENIKDFNSISNESSQVRVQHSNQFIMNYNDKKQQDLKAVDQCSRDDVTDLSYDRLQNSYNYDKDNRSMMDNSSVYSDQSVSVLSPYGASDSNRMQILKARQRFFSDQNTNINTVEKDSAQNKLERNHNNKTKTKNADKKVTTSKEKSKKKKKKKKQSKKDISEEEEFGFTDKKKSLKGGNKVEEKINDRTNNLGNNEVNRQGNGCESLSITDLNTWTCNNNKPANMDYKDSTNLSHKKTYNYGDLSSSRHEGTAHNNNNVDYNTVNKDSNPVYRTQSSGTVPKQQFFKQNGSRTSLIETDLDTGISTERPLVYETDLDTLQNGNRSKSVGNIHKTTKSHVENTTSKKDKFERTQSMVYLSKEKEREKLSEHEQRVNRSLSKLHLPSWYTNVQKQDLQLENTHRDITHTEPQYQISSAHREGVPAMIVKTKPVVIQHRVNTPAMIASSRMTSHPMTSHYMMTSQNDNKENDFRLPSTRWKKDSHSFKPIPIKALHEVSFIPPEEIHRPAKEAYLRLKAEQENKANIPSYHGSFHNTNVNNPAQFAYNSVQQHQYVDNNQETDFNKDNDGYNPYQGHLDPTQLSNDPNMTTTHTYVNIDAPYEEPPPPLPPRMVPPPLPPKRQTSDYSSSVDIKLSPSSRGTKKTHSETSSSPDVLFDSAYSDSLSKGQHDDSYTSNTSNQFNKQQTYNSHSSGLQTNNKTDPSLFTGGNHKTGDSVGIGGHTYKDSDNSMNQGKKYFKTSTDKKEHLQDSTQVYEMEPSNKKPSYIDIVEPLVEKAKASPNWRVAQFGNDLETDLELLEYHNSPGSRRPFSGSSPVISPDNSMNGSLNNPRIKTMVNGTVVNQDNLSPQSPPDGGSGGDKDSSIDISKGNTTFEDMLDGLLGIPSLNSSMLDASRASFRKNSADISPSMVKPETPLETVYRLIGTAQPPADDKSRDSNQSFLSVSQGGVKSPMFPQVNDSSMDTLESSANFDGNSYTVKCKNPKCKKEVGLEEARESYKTCHNCFTYYCSRDCRKAHWERHKKKCVFSRVNSHCKHIIKKIHGDPAINEEVSKTARTGYIQKGRGSVIISFSSLEKADKFLNDGIAANENPLAFISISEMEESHLFGEQTFDLTDLCRTYNPQVKYILEVVILGCDQIAGNKSLPIPRHQGTAIKKCAKLRLAGVNKESKSKSSSSNKIRSSNNNNVETRINDNDTLILTAVPGADLTVNMEERKAREICFTNIQSKLRDRGISLRHQYPEEYKKLCMYVSDKTEFAPITLFPTDKKTGKPFMCLIMPNSEPDVEWRKNPGLMQELGLHTEV